MSARCSPSDDKFDITLSQADPNGLADERTIKCSMVAGPEPSWGGGTPLEAKSYTWFPVDDHSPLGREPVVKMTIMRNQADSQRG